MINWSMIKLYLKKYKKCDNIKIYYIVHKIPLKL